MNEPDIGATLLAILINWLPNLLLIAIWIAYFRKTIALQRDAIGETRRLADASERAVALMEKRS